MFSSVFFPAGATAAALKSEAAVDGNRTEAAGRVANLQPRLRVLRNKA